MTNDTPTKYFNSKILQTVFTYLPEKEYRYRREEN